MLTITHKIMKTPLKNFLMVLFGLTLLNAGCKKDTTTTTTTQTPPPSYSQTNLVSDTASIQAGRKDTMLGNAWGIAISPTGVFWISANHTGSTVVYDNTGAQFRPVVSIPNGKIAASPTGVVYNTTTEFPLPNNAGASLFIYATEDGILSAWNVSTGNTTVTVADRSSSGAVYKGIALAADNGVSYLYATDFHNAKIDVYDGNFNHITKTFSDPNMPAGFAPFNIANINGMLYVTYAKQKAPDNHDDLSGAGNGYVDIFMPSGTLVKRFASQGALNSPWGIAAAPSTFGQGTGSILIGNFGDGHISVYDVNGNYTGQLMNGSTAIVIKGLWDITFDNVAPADPNQLYFTAGPDDESHGIFGYLKKN